MDKEKLIGLVFIREPIWNKRDKNHHNCIILNKLWKEIAKECNLSEATVKGQWKRLRQTFIKKLSEEPLKRSGDGADDDNEKHKWPFFDSLLFLKDTCTPRATEGNFFVEDNTDNALSDLNDDDVDIADDSSSHASVSVSESVSNSRPASTMSTSTPLSKRAKNQRIYSGKKDALGESLIRVEQEKIEYLKRKEENRQKRQEMSEENASRKDIDEDESFFRSILPHVKTFNANSKLQFRIDVLQLVQKYKTQTGKTNAHSSTERQSQIVEKYPPETQSSTEPHLTELIPIQQNLLPTSGHSDYYPHNEYHNSGNLATNIMYRNPHFENNNDFET